MILSRLSAIVGKPCRIAAAGVAVAAPLWLGAAAAAAETITFKAVYAISMSGIVVGRAEAESRFIGNSYAAAISGATSGATRLVSDASAKLVGSGRFYGSKVVPSSYNLETLENGFATHVRMAMRSGRITDLIALPGLVQARDRVPITAWHKTNIVDPLSAFLVPLDRPGLPSGARACARTVKIFDGWTRYDIQLYYKETRAIDGGADTYSGRIIVCGAYYIPIAGHRSNRKAIQGMASNTRLEVWLAPVKDLPLLVPFRILVGTDLGDLVVHAMRFSTKGPERQANAK